jgi:excisionase family DNA binding protein
MYDAMFTSWIMQGEHQMEVERLFLRVGAASEMLSLGRTTLLELAYRGEVPSIKVGRARLFAVRDLKEWADRQIRANR